MRVIDPIARAHHAEVVGVDFRREQQGWVLRLYVEKEGAAAERLSVRDAAVDLELCAGISRDLGPALDVADLITHAYHLEVSSPGVERPLRHEKDFERFAGQKAKLRLRSPTASGGDSPQRVVVGTLVRTEQGAVHVAEAGGRTHQIPLANIESARLVFEFGASSPRGRSHPGTHSRPQSGHGAHPRKH
jgi:ribosome maturation factor RimP